ncbi:MAG: hypothetical protein JW708_12580 [Vallitaleaceae bacterium]|nr:hypothetical protein [Vallitaleaceae bacterium]
MLLAIIGESCTGKSTLADRIIKEWNAKIFSGKDYLRFSKNENEAKSIFIENLRQASKGEENIIYVISEKEHLDFVKDIGIRVLITADIEVIKERFSLRMNGRLPEPVAKMLEAKHGMFDQNEYDYKFSMTDESLEKVSEELLNKLQLR